MAVKLTTEVFITKANIKHNNKYSYEKSKWVKSNKFITITCPIHGDFEQRGNCHLRGKGCKKCGLLKRAEKRTYTSFKFIEKAKKIHGDKYDYSLVDYINTTTLVQINCHLHGVFTKQPNKHLQGQGCIECMLLQHNGRFKNLTNEEFLEKIKKVHGCEYDYSLTNYISAIEPIIIICNTHGEFLQTPHSHLSGAGCNICGHLRTVEAKTDTIEQFINKSVEKHGELYGYDLVKYINNTTKVEIICKEHGVFKQAPISHKSGNGCPKCGLESTIANMKENPTGWSLTNWIKSSKISNHFESFKFYIIKCWDENEEFYKIGRTFKSVENRFKCKTQMPYNWEIVHVWEEEAEKVFYKEIESKKAYKSYKYLPFKSFGGQYECFNKNLPIENFNTFNLHI